MEASTVRVDVDGRKLRLLGSSAKLGTDLDVIVIGVQVQTGPRIVYEVAWTLGGDRHVEWVEEVELS